MGRELIYVGVTLGAHSTLLRDQSIQLHLTYIRIMLNYSN